MKRIKETRRNRSGPPPGTSRYSEKRASRPMELMAAEKVTFDPAQVIQIREKRVRATVPEFTNRQEFMFPVTTDGEQLFLTMRTIEKSGLNIRPGDTIQCDVEASPKGSCRRVAHIHTVIRAPRGVTP